LAQNATDSTNAAGPDGHDTSVSTNADLKPPGVEPDASKSRISLSSVHEFAGFFKNISLIPVGERVVERFENGLKLRVESARRNEFSDGRGESAFAVIETYYANGQRKQRYHGLFVADYSRWVLIIASYYTTGQLEYEVQYGNGIIEKEQYFYPTGQPKKRDIDLNILGDPQAIAVILSAQALLSDVWPANSEVPVPPPDAPKGSASRSNDSAVAARQQAPQQEPDFTQNNTVNAPAAEEAARELVRNQIGPEYMEGIYQETAQAIALRFQADIQPTLKRALSDNEKQRLVFFWYGKIKELLPTSVVESLLVPVVTKYLTTNEIQELNRFYNTPLGKKLTKLLPSLTREAEAAGEQLGTKSLADKRVIAATTQELKTQFPQWFPTPNQTDNGGAETTK
jgi:hypothetical protein